MILLIDNYDSFTFNLYQVLSVLGAEVTVVRNDVISVEDALAMKPLGVVISPGPGNPGNAGISCELVRRLAGRTPVLGVCLGHQCIAAAYGGKIVRASELVHGKSSLVYHQGEGVFAGLPSPFEAVRYHSLAVDRHTLPSNIRVTAQTADGTIMGLRVLGASHEAIMEGVQFHPESILTLDGPRLLQNFLNVCDVPQHAIPALAR